MNVAILLAAVAASGVNFGWQALPDGGVEYIVQVEPALAEQMLRSGDAIRFTLPADIQTVRYLRFQAGDDPQMKKTGQLVAASASFGWQSLADGSSEYIVQVEPAVGDSMVRRGDALRVTVPKEAHGVRQYRFQVGADPPPRLGLLSTTPVSAMPQSSLGSFGAAPTDDRHRWVQPQFGLTPDDPNLARGPIEPYRPVTPALPEATSRVRTSFESDNSFPGYAARPPVLRNDPLVHNKPSLTKTEGLPLAAVGAASSVVDDGTRPWLPLTFTALLLFASLGTNLYLGWLARDYYWRYRDMVTGEGPTSLV